MRRKIFSIFTLAVVVFFCGTLIAPAWAVDETASPAIGVTSAGGSSLEIEGSKLFRDNGSGEPGDEVQGFKPTDHVQHFLVKMKSLKFGSVNGKWVFTGVNTAAGDNIKIAETTMNGLISNQFTGKLSLEKEWPIGIYKADLFVSDKLLTTIHYIVSLPVEEMKTRAIKLYRDDGKRGPGEEVKAFTNEDKTLHFEISADGLFPIGTKVKWVYYAVETTAGSNTMIKEVSIELDEKSAPGDTLTSYFTLNDGWPVGTYKVEMHINDKLFETIPFKVEKK